jgi:glycerol-3-phosphate dehydrogenase
MAEDVLDKCFEAALLQPRKPGTTATLRLVGAGAVNDPQQPKISDAPGLHAYGTEQPAVQALPGADRWLGGGVTEGMVRFAARFEYARTVEDVLARRSRLLFLDAKLAGAIAPTVAEILREETGVDPQLDSFLVLAQLYLTLPT